MKRFLMISLMAALALSLAGVAGAQERAPRPERREWRQHMRIQRGFQRGQLTRGEALRLRLRERQIHRTEWRMRRDQRFTMRERMRLHRMLGRQDARIWRLRHNGRWV